MNSRFLIGLCVLIFSGSLSITAFGQRPRTPQSGRTPPPPAKPTCPLTQATLPRIAGVQMGSTYDEVLSVYPEIANDKHFQEHLESDNSGLTKVRALSLFGETSGDEPVEVGFFFTDRVLSVISNGGANFKSIDEAITEYSRILGVDESLWTRHFDYAAELRCVDFTFYANSVSEKSRMTGNSMSIHSTVNLKNPAVTN